MKQFIRSAALALAAILALVSGGAKASTSYTCNGNTYVMPDQFNGYGYVTAWPAQMNDCNTQLLSYLNSALAAQNAAQAAAAASATSASTQGMSTTSLTIGLGTQSPTIQASKNFTPGMPVRIADQAAPTANYMDGVVSAYNSSTGAMTVTVTSVSGSGTKTAWNVFLVGQRGPPSTTMPRSDHTGAYSIAVGDGTSLIRATSGTWAMTLPAPSSAGAGWWAIVQNTGTGTVTLTASTGTVDGLASYPMYPNESRLVQTDGSTFVSVILSPFDMIVTSSVTFIVPPGYNNFDGILTSGGAGGISGTGGSNSYGGSSGGGAAPFELSSAALGGPGASVTITIAAQASAGNNGNGSSFGSIFSVTGGSVGLSNVSGGSTGLAGGGIQDVVDSACLYRSTTGISPGGTGPRCLYAGGYGGSTSTNATSGLSGSPSVYGGGGSGGVGTSSVGASAGSLFGGAAGASVLSGTAADGTAPAGAGGASGNGTGGHGARGQLSIHGAI